MQTLKNCLLRFVLVGCLAGCSNALYFYETEKISLTLEARPDSSQPVQGNLGVKQRVVLIAPKKNENEDALSAISSFSFKIIPKPDTIFNPVLIQTAFITGEAASSLKELEAQLAAQAIALDQANLSVGTNITLMRNIVNSLDKNSKQDQKHIDLLNGLGRSVVPEKYPVPIFGLDGSGNLDIASGKNSDVTYTDINSALSYWGELDGSSQKIISALNKPGQYKFQEIPVSNEMIKNGLQKEYSETKKESDRISSDLGKSPIYLDAVQYFIDKYIKKTITD
jgi:hypothetical protein